MYAFDISGYYIKKTGFPRFCPS